jgi:hypothetical protein
MDDSIGVGQERSAREIDGKGVKTAACRSGFRRLNRGVPRRCDHVEAGLGQPARNMAPEKAPALVTSTRTSGQRTAAKIFGAERLCAASRTSTLL